MDTTTVRRDVNWDAVIENLEEAAVDRMEASRTARAGGLPDLALAYMSDSLVLTSIIAALCVGRTEALRQ